MTGTRKRYDATETATRAATSSPNWPLLVIDCLFQRTKNPPPRIEAIPRVSSASPSACSTALGLGGLASVVRPGFRRGAVTRRRTDPWNEGRRVDQVWPLEKADHPDQQKGDAGDKEGAPLQHHVYDFDARVKLKDSGTIVQNLPPRFDKSKEINVVPCIGVHCVSVRCISEAHRDGRCYVGNRPRRRVYFPRE